MRCGAAHGQSCQHWADAAQLAALLCPTQYRQCTSDQLANTCVGQGSAGTLAQLAQCWSSQHGEERLAFASACPNDYSTCESSADCSAQVDAMLAGGYTPPGQDSSPFPALLECFLRSGNEAENATNCAPVYMAESGFLNSTAGYNSYDKCMWVLTCSNPAHAPAIAFSSFATEPLWDNVLVFDGDLGVSGSTAGLRLLAQFSGSTVPLPVLAPLHPSGSAVTVQLVADSSVVRNGFSANFSCAPAVLAILDIKTHSAVGACSLNRDQGCYGVGTMTNGTLLYNDHVAVATGVPAFLQGLNFIRGSNGDSTALEIDHSFVCFNVTMPSTIYILYDHSTTGTSTAGISGPPGWIAAYFPDQHTTTVGILNATEPLVGGMSIYYNEVPSGRTCLGGNGGSPSRLNYVVLVGPSGVHNVTRPLNGMPNGLPSLVKTASLDSGLGAFYCAGARLTLALVRWGVYSQLTRCCLHNRCRPWRLRLRDISECVARDDRCCPGSRRAL
jgi:hypothetical protein